MIKGVQDIYYNVSNMKKAVSFYSDCLNMQIIHSDQHWTTLECGGINIGLHWTEGNAVPVIPKDSHGAHAGATLTLESSDIAEDRVTLEKSGAKILDEADAPWGHMLVFEDLDGNVLKLMKPKH